MTETVDERRKQGRIVHMELPKAWPDWTIKQMIGEGSYGTVYEAVRSDGRKAAVKVIPVPYGENEYTLFNAEPDFAQEVIRKCLEEVRLMQSLSYCENIVRIDDSAVEEDEEDEVRTIFIRMELLQTLASFFPEDVADERNVVRMGMDISNALRSCHAAGILHRDIKPENILVSDSGVFKLSDFGLARTLLNGQTEMTMAGTLYYMAPEVQQGGHYDERADIYSLGLVMYRLLNRRKLPFLNTDKKLVTLSEREKAFERRMSGENLPPPADASAACAEIILKACSFRKEDRYESAEAFHTALEQLWEAENTEHSESAKSRSGGPLAAPFSGSGRTDGSSGTGTDWDEALNRGIDRGTDRNRNDDRDRGRGQYGTRDGVRDRDRKLGGSGSADKQSEDPEINSAYGTQTSAPAGRNRRRMMILCAAAGAAVAVAAGLSVFYGGSGIRSDGGSQGTASSVSAITSQSASGKQGSGTSGAQDSGPAASADTQESDSTDRSTDSQNSDSTNTSTDAQVSASNLYDSTDGTVYLADVAHYLQIETSDSSQICLAAPYTKIKYTSAPKKEVVVEDGTEGKIQDPSSYLTPEDQQLQRQSLDSTDTPDSSKVYLTTQICNAYTDSSLTDKSQTLAQWTPLYVISTADGVTEFEYVDSGERAYIDSQYLSNDEQQLGVSIKIINNENTVALSEGRCVEAG